jgi:hypothetical protein
MSRPFPIMQPDRHNERMYLKARNLIIMGVDWDMMEEHEAQAEKNHDQSLRVLAGRMGLSACEALAVLEDRDWHHMPLDEAYTQLIEFERRWKAARGK